MAKALIIHATDGGESAVIGEHIAGGLRHNKVEGRFSSITIYRYRLR